MVSSAEMRYDFGFYRHYDPPDERNAHMLLYVRDTRAIGVCVVERRDHVWRCTWNGNGAPTCVELPEHAPMWSIGFLWVHAPHRRTGIGQRLISCCLRVLGLVHDGFGWYTPFSPAGEGLVRRMYPTSFYVAK
jgi:GNAT superfamily N-acetyltransferase